MRLLRSAVLCLLLTAVSLSLVTAQDEPTVETDPLDKPVSVTLSNASMSEAIGAVGKVSGLGLFGPAEPVDGITLLLDRQPLRTVLDMLARSAGVQWDTVGEAVVFVKPSAEEGAAAEINSEPLTLQQKVAALVTSMNSEQMYALSSGVPLQYSALDAYQKELVAAILSPPTIGFTADGEVVRNLPAPETTTISFWTLPYLVVPPSAGAKSVTLRLDSTPFVELREAVAK